MIATLAHWPQLTGSDRCDRCGARAQLRVVFATGQDLLFCRHHGNHYEPGLLDLDVVLLPAPLPLDAVGS